MNDKHVHMRWETTIKQIACPMICNREHWNNMCLLVWDNDKNKVAWLAQLVQLWEIKIKHVLARLMSTCSFFFFCEITINTEWHNWCNLCNFVTMINTDLHGWCQHIRFFEATAHTPKFMAATTCAFVYHYLVAWMGCLSFFQTVEYVAYRPFKHMSAFYNDFNAEWTCCFIVRSKQWISLHQYL